MRLLHLFGREPCHYPKHDEGLAEGVYQLWHSVNLEHKLPPDQRLGDYFSGMDSSRTYFVLLPSGKSTLVAKVVNNAPIVGDLGPLSAVLGEGALLPLRPTQVTTDHIVSAYPVDKELPNYREDDHFGLRRALGDDHRRIMEYLESARFQQEAVRRVS